MIWLTVIVFIALLLLLVLSHELGHFLAAKKAGCKVEEFAFGFPPKIASIRRGGTTYSFNLLPLGGYVRIEGEDMEELNPGPKSFGSKSALWRIIILSAGVFMNVVLAALFLSIGAGVGQPTLITQQNKDQVKDIKTYIIDVRTGSPAEAAGLQPLDRIEKLGDITDPDIDTVSRVVGENVGKEMFIKVDRLGENIESNITPRESWPPDEGPLGIVLQGTGLEKVPWWKAPYVGIIRTGEMLTVLIQQFTIIIGRLITGSGVGPGVAGPIGIAVLTNEFTAMGLPYVLDFGAIISLNLALINILPFPALDGGRILFVLAEIIIGRRVPRRLERYTHLTGFAMLIALMILITFKDIGRFF